MLLGLLAIAHAAKAPCWLSAPCAPYDSATHVVGVGSGATPAAADDAARAEIAKVFSVRIARTEESLVQATRSDGKLSQRTALAVTTTAETERQLQGVTIAERFTGKDRVYWALAVLDRAPAVSAVRDRIASQERLLADLGGTPPERVRKLGKALPEAEKLAYLAEELAVLDPSAGGPSVRFEELVRQRDEAWAAIGVVVDPGPWHDPLAAAVTAQSLAVRAQGELRVVLTVAETVAKPDANGFVKVSYAGTLQVLEAGAEVASAPVGAEAASRTPDKARELAKSQLAEALAAAGPLVAGVLE